MLEDLEAVAPGWRVLAGELPVGNGLSVDVLACDARGRLGLIQFALEADAAAAARAVEVWDRTAASMELLRLLLAGTGADLTTPPRLLLICTKALEGARRIGGHVAAPEIEIQEIALLAADGRRGLLAERAEAVPPPATRPTAADPVLGAVPPGQARALMRRVLEELRGSAGAGTVPEAMALGATVEVRLSGRPAAWMLESEGVLEVRRPGNLQVMRVAQDAECRAAVRFMLEPEVAASREPPSGPAGPSAALSKEEILEFEKLGKSSGAWKDPPRRGGFVEN